jgi:hypothetical protein
MDDPNQKSRSRDSGTASNVLGIDGLCVGDA